MASENLMTITELAGYLKVTKRTIYEWLKFRKIPAVKLVELCSLDFLIKSLLNRMRLPKQLILLSD